LRSSPRSSVDRAAVS